MGFVKIEKTKDCPGPEQKVATVATDHYCPAVGRFPGCPRRKHLGRLACVSRLRITVPGYFPASKAAAVRR